MGRIEQAQSPFGVPQPTTGGAVVLVLAAQPLRLQVVLQQVRHFQFFFPAALIP